LPNPASRQTLVFPEDELRPEMHAAGVNVAVLDANTPGIGKREARCPVISTQARMTPTMVGGCHS
jgi:hypothetical protein